MVRAQILLSLLFVLFSWLQATGAEPDSILIRNYLAASYKASSFNYTGIEDSDGVLLFANENGVLEYDGSNWRLITINNFSAAVFITSINGTIYVGGRNEFGYLKKNEQGLYEYHSLRHLLTLSNEQQLTDIWQIVGVGDNIYFQSFEMILRYDGEKVTTIPLKGAYIFKVQDELLASAPKMGLAKIYNDTFTYVNPRFTFDNDAAFQYLVGINGENLLATADHGLYELDTTTYATKKWDGKANDLLANSSLYNVVIWRDSLYASATYKAGLLVLNENGALVKTYNRDSGLLTNALREMVLDRRGNLWLTTDNGLSLLQVDAAPVQPGDLHTIVKQVTVQDKDIAVTEKQAGVVTAEDYSGSVVFHFATPGFLSEELEYSYYLEGFENSWSAWKSEVKKEYTNLQGGEYTFHVKSRYKGKIESQPASVALSVPIPWFKTKAAYFFGFLFIASAVAAGVHYRTKRLKLINKRLAKIISNRTQELVAQREQLRATNNELRVRNTELDNFVYRSSHDLVAPLKSMKGLIHIAKEEKDEAIRSHYFKLMHTSVDKLEEFIKSIMEYSSNSKKGIAREEIDLNELLDSIVADLKYYDQADRIELLRKLDTDIPLFSDPKRLKIILSNLVTNSIKYHNYRQEYLYIEVRAEVADGFFKIHVADNGKGIEKEYLGKIFDMFFRATDSAQGSGLGLYIVKDTVQKLGGDIQVDSEINKGTVFTLLFPC